MNHNKPNIINDIITQNRYYGKKIPQKRIKLVISNNNISVSNLIYLDSLSRVLSLINNVDIDYINFSDSSLNIKKELDKIRITLNQVINIADLDKDIEELLDYLRYNPNCYIQDNSLYIGNCQLVDEIGNYTNYLRKANYYQKQSANYDYILVIDNDLENYIYLLNVLSLNNIISLDLSESKSIKYENNIDKLRIDAISLSKNLNEIETTYQSLNNLITNYKPTIIDNYNNLNTPIELKLIAILEDYNNIIVEVYNKLELKKIINYIENLIDNINQYTNELNTTNKLTNEQLNLLVSLKIILNNSLDLLGIITIY
jgi:hypothetical protein